MFTFFKRYTSLLFLLTLFVGFFYFYNLNWGAPFYFHPDERNIASAVSQLIFPTQLNPHFFAYGSLPIYKIFFAGLLTNGFHTTLDPFSVAIIISRFYSALFSLLLIPLVFLIGRKLKDETAGFIAALLAATSTGFMQYAHFGTFEVWLTFFSVLLFWFCLKFIEKQRIRDVIFLGLIFGILTAVKITSLALLPLPILAFLFSRRIRKHTYSPSIISPNIFYKKQIKIFIILLEQFIILLSVAGLVYIIANPFVFLDTESFLSSMRYESSVGFNTLPVFYTNGFYDSIPVLYQFQNVYPFLLNPVMTLIFIFSFIYVLIQSLRTKHTSYLLLISFFLILFLSQAFLFIKWTRYLVPTLPFIYIIVGIALSALSRGKKKRANHGGVAAIILMIAVNCIFCLSYFITAFVHQDTRIAALQFAKKEVPSDAVILSEMYDLGITPFNDLYPKITLFNTYDLDFNSPDFNQQAWEQALEESEYIILPSQRVLQTRIQNPKKFPIGHKAYVSLLNGSAGFHQIYKTPCDIFCRITYLNDPIYRFEQTSSVFDRPTVMIFKK